MMTGARHGLKVTNDPTTELGHVIVSDVATM